MFPDPVHQSFKFLAPLAHHQFQVLLVATHSKLKGPLDLSLVPNILFSDHGPSAEGLDDAESDGVCGHTIAACDDEVCAGRGTLPGTAFDHGESSVNDIEMRGVGKIEFCNQF